MLIAQQHYACFGFAKSILGVWRFLVGGGFALGLLDVFGRREFPCEDPSGSHDASRSKGFADFLVVQGLADCLGLDEATDFFGLGAVEEFPELVGQFGQHNLGVPHLFDYEGRGVGLEGFLLAVRRQVHIELNLHDVLTLHEEMVKVTFLLLKFLQPVTALFGGSA